MSLRTITSSASEYWVSQPQLGQTSTSNRRAGSLGFAGSLAINLEASKSDSSVVKSGSAPWFLNPFKTLQRSSTTASTSNAHYHARALVEALPVTGRFSPIRTRIREDPPGQDKFQNLVLCLDWRISLTGSLINDSAKIVTVSSINWASSLLHCRSGTKSLSLSNFILG